MVNNYRIWVNKKEGFKVEEEFLYESIKTQLQLKALPKFILYNIYDCNFFTDEEIKILCHHIVADKVTDNYIIKDSIDYASVVAYENLPGQFSQRAAAVLECAQLFMPIKNKKVSVGQALVFNEAIALPVIEKLKTYLINPIENRQKDLSTLNIKEDVAYVFEKETIIDNFITSSTEELRHIKNIFSIVMSEEDILFVQDYFKQQNRNPTLTEIKVLDTYWSDHCRHKTFNTILKDIHFCLDGNLSTNMEQVFQQYITLKKTIGQSDKPISLMDMATIVAKYRKYTNTLPELDVSDENNACSIEIDVSIKDKTEKWLLMFKNETHNHPTEIEPYGGASTCVGGAIRDPLSGRSYVFQSMRITGAADITEKIEDTLPNKLPQRIISTKAAQGFSSYGNQIGLATTFVKEIFHPGYKAKRMEVGVVVGAVKKENVMRQTLSSGDVIILLGGATGRDGIGGATGSSVELKENALMQSQAEVQKGNAPIERKIQRLFRKEEVSKLIKKCNDFGAGGVCVAVGEMADGLEIELDKVPLKYNGLTPTEITISESQERMAIGLAVNNADAFIQYAQEENLDAVVIAKVTDNHKLVIKYQGHIIVNLDRSFIDSAGVNVYQNVYIDEKLKSFNPFKDDNNEDEELTKKIEDYLQNNNLASMQGMKEMFDASIGSTTVLMPFGGIHQLTEEDVSVQLLPVLQGNTSTSSVLSYGFDPYLSEYHPFLGASYAVIISLAKLVAAGASYKNAYLSFQEYFQKLGDDKNKWSKPFMALLGAMDAQLKLNVAAIGGKDSMSGSFKDIHVPPTLISFAINTANAQNIISSNFKQAGNFVYLVKHPYDKNYTPHYDILIKNFDAIEQLIASKIIVTAKVIQAGGIIETIFKMCIGNKIGIQCNTQENLFDRLDGSFIIEACEKIEKENFYLLGHTIKEEVMLIQNAVIALKDCINAYDKPYQNIYPPFIKSDNVECESINYLTHYEKNISFNIQKPKILVPVFSGTNCEYDIQKCFENEGAEVKHFIFKNGSQQAITDSITALTKEISSSHIIVFAGGFSASDEPDGSGKFIANVINNQYIYEALQHFLQKKHLILGICNGFQGLIKSGLLPYGNNQNTNTKDYITLFKNTINRHVSRIVHTRISSTKSPWLNHFNVGDIHAMPVSHGEGRIIASPHLIQQLKDNGQITTQYVNLSHTPTMQEPYNPNGSALAIESLISPCGHIFGKMGHSERFAPHLYKNIPHITYQNIFKNGVNYFKY